MESWRPNAAFSIACWLAVLFYLCIYFWSPKPQEKLSIGDESSNFPSKERKNQHDWINTFKFVPNGLESCPDLFKNIGNKTTLFPVEFNEAYRNFLKKVPKVKEGYSASYIEEFLVMYLLAKAPSVRTVCETGFNAGHSAFTWLQSNSKARLYSFDIGTHAYARPMAEFLKQSFPERFNITWGDSTLTLPEFRKIHPEVTCDLISIDGGHTYKACKSDYENFKKMAHSESIVMLDNYPDKRFLKPLGDVWERAKREGEISEIFQCNYWPDKPQGFSVGRMNVH